MILGNTRWTLDFSHFVLSEAFDLADEFESVLNDQEAFTLKRTPPSLSPPPFPHQTNKKIPVKSITSIPLITLLSSMSRAFLRFICRGLRGVHAGFANTNPATLSNDSKVYYTEICQALETSAVRIDVYEKFLAGVDSAVKHAYQGAGFGDAERPGPEKELLVNARIPPVLVSAVATLLRQTVPTLKGEINRKNILLNDYSWLGFGTDSRTALYRRQRDVDILKKIPLRPALPVGRDGRVVQVQKRRRCVRCCEVSGDTTLPRSLPYFKMLVKLNLLRACPCGGMWMLETDAAGLPASGAEGRNSQGILARTSAPAPGSISVPVPVMGSG